MKINGKGIWKLALAAGLAVLMGMPAMAAETQGQGKAVVTVINKRDKNAPITVPQESLKLKVDGRPAMIEHWAPAKGPLQVVLLIDSAAWSSLGTQMNDMANFIRSLPASVEVGVAYMESGQAAFSAPLTKNKAAAARGLHLPSGVPGGSASPYFCLSDLAKHWPSHNMDARREVIMITNGVDNYEPRFNPNDPYVLAAIHDAVKAGLVVNSIYWHSRGIPASMYMTSTGQSLLLMVSQATGGKAYWQGFGNPVSFAPYFKEMKRRFGEQYNLVFRAQLGKRPYAATVKLKTSTPGAKLVVPGQVWVMHPGSGGEQ